MFPCLILIFNLAPIMKKHTWYWRMLFAHPFISPLLALIAYTLWVRHNGTPNELVTACVWLIGWLVLGPIVTMRLWLQKNADGKTYRVREFWYTND